MQSTQVWTVKSVKEELPSVTVKVGNVRYYGRVTGRLNRFATVTLIEPIEPKHKRTHPMIAPNTPLWSDHEFAWETIASALNKGTDLGI
jgi:hypothetical protein